MHRAGKVKLLIATTPTTVKHNKQARLFKNKFGQKTGAL